MSNDQSSEVLHVGQAAKSGVRAKGLVHYQIVSNPERSRLWFQVTQNDGGGYFSKEFVDAEEVLRCLQAANGTVTSKAFVSAFVSKSANNAGFLLAILRDQKLLVPDPDGSGAHLLGEDFQAWKSQMLQAPVLPDVSAEAAPKKPRPRRGKGHQQSLTHPEAEQEVPHAVPDASE